MKNTKVLNDFPPKDALDLLASLEKMIKRDFGKKCSDYVEGCACCSAWKSFNTIKKLYN